MLSSGSVVFQRLQNLLCIQQLCDLASGLLSWALLDLLPVLCALTWSSWVFLSVSYAFVMVQFSSVTQSCLTLCDPMDCNTSGLPVHHQLPEFTQTHVHWVGDAIQPSHPPSSPSPPAFNFSQHQGLFQWASSSPQVAEVQSIGVSASALVLPMNTQDWSPLGWTGWISLQSKGLSRVFSNTTVQKHQFYNIVISLQLIKINENFLKKTSILRHSAFFIVQLSHPYIVS